MRRKITIAIAIAPLLFCLTPLLPGAESAVLDGVEFCWRVPANGGADGRIMVLFGGRNWPARKTLETFRFDELADRHGLFLLAASFRDREYWEPQAWSGPLLLRAVALIERRYGLNSRKLLLYGYSAGGQCSNLFYAWMPERVAAWGAHGCGVYFRGEIAHPAPAFLSCGVRDAERFAISREFVYRYREAGGALLWKYSLESGHELTPEALALARAWFDAFLSGERCRSFGEDDTGRIVPASRLDSIDPEFRNPLYEGAVTELWKR